MGIEHDDCLKRGKIKPFSRGKGLAPKELETAVSDLATAKKTFDDGNFKWACVQVYYAMFHTARALLYAKNLREHSHYCLIEAMRVLYVENKKFPVAFVEALQKAKTLREEADYYNRWSEESCRKLIEAAEMFLATATELIKEDAGGV